MKKLHKIELLILLASLFFLILDDPASLSDNRVRAILKDRSGAVWTETIGGGLDHFAPETRQFIRYQHDEDDLHRWWFSGAMLILLVGLVVAGIRWRISKIERKSRSLETQVTERTKELNCLYSISQLVETPDISLEEILQGTVDLIPPTWQYPEVTCARITLEGQEFSTENFAPSPWQQTATILVHSEQSGTVQVGYLQERPQSDEGPFLKEERDLLNAIAERLGESTERLRTEQQVREQRQFLQNVLDSLAHPFYVINAETHIVEMANAAAHTGRLRGEITCHVLTHGNDQPCEGAKHPCPLREVKKTKKPVIVEHTHIGRDGTLRIVEVHGFPILNDAGNVVQVIEYTLDITERKRAEERVRQHEARLSALEERERIGRELHDDLGQVMAYVNMQAQAVRMLLERSQPEQAQAALEQLSQVAQEAHDDVRQYILGVRTSAPAAANFFEELNQYLDQLHARYGLETRVTWPDELARSPLSPEVETQLLRIIQEALTNIRKHANVNTARIFSTLHPDEIQVIISDAGQGFYFPESPSPDPQSPHFGLTIMRERAEAIGGSLHIDSEPGGGTQVIVRLPRVLELEPDQEIRGLRVLLVDDHPLYREGLRNILSVRGVQVVGMAHDGLEAQVLARQLLPDLILMDVQMPGCDGLEATLRIKAELPDVKIVMLTIAADDETLFQALKNGASGYLLKNLDERQFFALLVEAMRGETVLSPSLATKVLTTFTEWTKDSEKRDPAPAASVTDDKAALTPRQHQVLSLVAQGLTYKEVGAELDLTERTIKHYMGQILETLHLENRRQAVSYAWRAGLVE